MTCCERFISWWTLIPPSRSAASAPPEARNQPRVSVRGAAADHQQAADQRVAIAHRMQEQKRRRRRLVGIAPQAVRAERIDEK